MQKYSTNEELLHYGVKGMKWGVRRYQNKDGSYTQQGLKRRKFTPTSPRAALAKRANDKVDAGFKNWKVNSEKRADAIELGKKYNATKRLSDANKSDKSLRKQAKLEKKDYKKALRGNTTYRKGQIKSAVLKDSSRKALSDAKALEKTLDSRPLTKAQRKELNRLRSKHAVDRAKARRAPEVAAARSRKIASLKRTGTMAINTAATSAAIAGGIAATNVILKNNGKTPMDAQKASEFIKKGIKLANKYKGYI